MEDVSKLDVMAKEFTNSTTMVKVTAMNINKRNVTLASASRFQLLTQESAAVRSGIFTKPVPMCITSI